MIVDVLIRPCRALALLATLSLLIMKMTKSYSLGSQLTRREAFDVALLHSSVALPRLSSWSVAADSTTVLSSSPFGVEDEVINSLVYEKVLGSGSFKTVYLVSTSSKDVPKQSFALAVERLRAKADVKDGLRGIQIAQQLQSMLREDELRFFEKIYGWWIQSTSCLSEFAEHELVFPNKVNNNERSQKAPKHFLGTKLLVSLKPVYDMDLQAFCKKTRELFSVGSAGGAQQPATSVAGISLTEQGAINLALDMIHAGRLMHARGLIHRDLKPKNVMLSRGRPVVIDFEFSYFVNKHREGRLCIQQPGRLKGEVRYVLAKDVEKYQACQEGDAYAMGQTLYEVLFGEAQDSALSLRQEITVSEAHAQNTKFRELLNRDDAGCQSRFHMSKSARDVLLAVIRGICREEQPLSFAEAESYMLEQFDD